MRVLLTGHKGYIGAVMLPVLQRAGHEVVGLDSDLYRNSTYGELHQDIPELIKDVRDVEKSDLEGIEAIVHLAGLSNDVLGDLNPELTYEINHHASVRLAEMARDLGIRRYGFHGASHKFIAERTAELLGNETVADRARGLYVNGPTDYAGAPLRVISCHLGGSSSVVGIRNGVAVGSSMGFSPQSGLPQNNRVGDLDSMAIPYVNKMLGLSVEEAERQLNKESGLLGLSGVSNDARDIREAAAVGHADAQIAVDVLVDSIRHWAGAFFFKMGGAEVIAFTAGIGENDPGLRAKVCAGLEDLGLVLDPAANEATIRGKEGIISAPESKIKVCVIPANEELVIAREVFRYKQNI